MQRIKIFFSILIIIILIFTTMGVLFHFGTRHYVQTRIQSELDNQIFKMKTGYYDEIGNKNFNYMFIKDSIVADEIENSKCDYICNYNFSRELLEKLEYHIKLDIIDWKITDGNTTNEKNINEKNINERNTNERNTNEKNTDEKNANEDTTEEDSLDDDAIDDYDELTSVYYKNSYTEDNLVPVSVVVVNSAFEKLDAKYDDNISLISYCREHTDMLGEKKYRHIKIRKTDYYVMARNDIINNQDVIFIIMASPDELYKFVSRINVIFVMIMIVSAIILFVVSCRAGIRLEQSRQKLKYYFQNASHELKTPIMSIQGFAEGINTDIIKDHKRASEIILAESEKMTALVEEILLLSKMDSGYADMSREKINLSDILYDCMNLLETEVVKRKISFEMELDSSKKYNVLGNEQQLERMFLNILSNAVRYAKNNVRVQIRQNRKWIKTDIVDDGTGIRKEDMPHIFDRFYKGYDGQSGIGLAIAKEIILLHKGKIKASNDGGAKFSVWLKSV